MSATPAADAPIVRPYRAADRDAVRAICNAAAFRGRGGRAMLDDPELFADYWTAYYTDFEPEACLVAEERGEVVGYLVGSADSRRFVRAMATHVVPRVVARLAWRYATGRYRHVPHRRAVVRWLVLRSWREAPSVDLRRFPAHYHVNLRAGAVAQGLYTRLAAAFIERMHARGVLFGHGHVTEPAERGPWDLMARAFDRRRPGWILHYDERESTMERALWGDSGRWMNRVYGFRLEDMDACLRWGARRFGG